MNTTYHPRFRVSKRSGMNLRMHPRAQDKFIPALGMSGSFFEIKRVDDMGPVKAALKASVKDLYCSNTVEMPLNSKFVLNDRRIDVLLHRSGLVNSIKAARQLVSHGHVYSEFKLITRPGYIVKPGVVISIKQSTWNNISKMANKQWSKWLNEGSRFIPPYLETDFINGSIILVNEPKENTVLIPVGFGVRN